MQIYNDHAVITFAGVLLAALVWQLRTAAHARDAIYPIPQTRLSSGGVLSILPFSHERRDSVAVLHNDHPPSLLVFRHGPRSKPHVVPSLPISGGIMDCALASDGNTFFIFTRGLSLLAVSARSWNVEWRSDVVFGARTRLDLESASIIPLNDASSLLIIGSHWNGTVFSALVDMSRGTRPRSVPPRFCGAVEADLTRGMHALQSFFDNDTGGPDSNTPSLPLTFSSKSPIIGERFSWEYPHGKKQADLYVMHGTRFAAAFSRSFSSSMHEPLCDRIGPSRSFASIEQLRNVTSQDGSLGLESLNLYLPCENCPAQVSRTVFFPGSRHDSKRTESMVTFANGMKPPLHFCHVHGIHDSMASTDRIGIVVVGGSESSGRMGLVSALDIERVEARPLWQALLAERPLFLHYSSVCLRIVVVTKRNVVILKAQDGGLVARIPLEERDGSGQMTRQRKGFGRSQAGVPTGLVAERDGVVWFAMNGAELAALGVDLRRVDLMTWPLDFLAVLLVVAVSCSFSIFLVSREGDCGPLKRRDPDIRDQRRGGNSNGKTAPRAPRLAGNPCAKTRAVKETASEESHRVFAKKDL